MHHPETIERMYLDFDGFFASVEQECNRRLRGRPVGVVTFEGMGDRGMLIAVSREAKEAGITSMMPVRQGMAKCADLVAVPQKPELYRRAHNELLSEIETVIPIDTAKSIDELTCVLDEHGRARPEDLAHRSRRQSRPDLVVIAIIFADALNRFRRSLYGRGHRSFDIRRADRHSYERVALRLQAPLDIALPKVMIEIVTISRRRDVDPANCVARNKTRDVAAMIAGRT